MEIGYDEVYCPWEFFFRMKVNHPHNNRKAEYELKYSLKNGRESIEAILIKAYFTAYTMVE